MKCQQCNYQWESRTKQPKQCPRCKRYDWDKKEGETNETKNNR